MAEMDAFERRVADTLLWYADEAAPTLDAATVAGRAALAHPRRAAAGLLPWRIVAIPRLAWVLLFAGLMTAALIGGTLLVGSQQRRLPAVVPPVGPAFACPPGSTPDEPGPIDQVRPGELEAMAFDRRAGRLVALARAGASYETWTFDVCTNTWTQMHPDRVPSDSEWAQLVYDTDSDMTILVSKDPDPTFDPDPSVAVVHVWTYDLQADTWTEKRVAADALLWAYDPLSGLVVAQGGINRSVPLSTYDVETDTWTPIREANGGPETGAVSAAGWPFYGVLAYDASVDRIVACAGAETWLFDIRSGRGSRSGVEAPDVIEVFATAPAFVYDEAAKRTVLIGDVPRLAAYDATADRWEILAEGDPDRAAGFQLHAVYDPVNRRLIGWRRDQDELFAFDLVTREWTVLLAASEGQPGQSPGATLRP
jgi:hypothetical protein